MQPWEVNDIDQTFKEAAENAHFDYEPRDWRALESQLGNVGSTPMWIKGMVTTAVVVLIGAIGYLAIDEDVVELSPVNELIIENNEVRPPATDIEVVQNLPTAEEGEQSTFGGLSGTAEDADLAESLSLSATEKTAEPEVPTPVGDQLLNVIVPDDQSTADDITPTGTEPLEAVPSAAALNVNLIGLRSKEASLPSMTYPTSLTASIDPVALDPTHETETAVVTPKKPGKWSLGVGYVRDNSGISFEGTHGGHGVSINTSYRLTDRISVISGVTKLHKTFEITKGLESYPELWDDVQIPLHILAESLVIEIPVNLRFQIVGSPKNNLFVSTGLSSYFMMEEDYIFDYHYSEGPNAIPGIEVKGKNNHIFSIYNLSLGFQRRVTRNFAIEIEPYLRLPMAGIGIWDVNLTSSGTHITARYFFK